MFRLRDLSVLLIAVLLLTRCTEDTSVASSANFPVGPQDLSVGVIAHPG